MKDDFHLLSSEIQEILEEVFGQRATSTETFKEVEAACKVMRAVADRYVSACVGLQIRCNVAEGKQAELFLENRMLLRVIDNLTQKTEETKQ